MLRSRLDFKIKLSCMRVSLQPLFSTENKSLICLIWYFKQLNASDEYRWFMVQLRERLNKLGLPPCYLPQRIRQKAKGIPIDLRITKIYLDYSSSFSCRSISSACTKKNMMGILRELPLCLFSILWLWMLHLPSFCPLQTAAFSGWRRYYNQLIDAFQD